MHVRLSNVLDGDSNVPLPNEHLLVVRGCDHLLALLNERNRVDGREVVVVFLCHLARGAVEREYLVVRLAYDEEVGVVGVELHTVGT